MYRDELTREGLLNIRPRPIDQEIYREIQRTWDGISKPIDGLGDFEKVICRIGAIQGKAIPELDSKAAVIFCSDNGIVAEGVSQVGSVVTLQVARMLGQGISSANTLADKSGVKVVPVDVGIDCDCEIPGVLARKVSRGTEDFLKEPAMTEAQALMAIGTGMDLAKELSQVAGAHILLAGEMGIGNTTTASALLALLTGSDGDEFVGRGAGLGDEGLKRKQEVVATAVSMYRNKEGDDSSFAWLCDVGGLDIAALVGLFIGGSLYGVPVVLDGVITASAALLADRLVPGVRDYVIPSHLGREKGLAEALNLLGLEPLVSGNMALGEATGAIMAMPLLDMALDFYRRASKFSDGKIEEYQRLS